MIDDQLSLEEFCGGIAVGDGNRSQAGAFGGNQSLVRLPDGRALARKECGVTSGVEEFDRFSVRRGIGLTGRCVAGGDHD